MKIVRKFVAFWSHCEKLNKQIDVPEANNIEISTEQILQTFWCFNRQSIVYLTQYRLNTFGLL